MQHAVVSLQLLMGMALAGAFLTPALATQQAPAAANTGEKDGGPSSVSQLKQIGLALLMYAQDYDEVLPPMENAATVKELLLPYVRGRNAAVFIDPRTHEPYQPNPTLSGRPLFTVAVDPTTKELQWRRSKRTRSVELGQLGQVVAFYEPRPRPDGTRAVLFLDGHVRVIPESEWPRLKRASKIP